MTSFRKWDPTRLLAEGLVIFAGVFLGLLADDHREARGRAAQAEDILTLVREDLRTDSAELSGILEDLEAHVRGTVVPA